MKHIESSRLFTFAEGSVELEEKEREHLNRCEDCQQVLSVFNTYVVDSSKKSQEEETFRGSKTLARKTGQSAA